MKTPKLDIAIAIPGLPINPESIEKGSIGGSETAGIQLAEAFGKLGYQVTLFANGTEATGPHDVSWRPIQQFHSFAGQVPHDITIVQRGPSLCGQAFASRLTVLWMHDLALRRNAPQTLGVLWNVDVMAVLSRYHLEQCKEVLGLVEPPLWQTRNGIDLSLFPPPISNRDKDLMVYSARPERGLDRLLTEIWPRIRVRIPTAKLVISGYDNPVEHLRAFYGECRYIADMYQGSVEYLPCLTKRQLYELYGRAGLYLYPTPSPRMPDFAEISCITWMECQAMGLPIVTTNAGAASETVALDAGALIEPGDNYADRFVEEVVRLRGSRADWLKASHAGQDVAQAMSWDVVAREWLEMFEEKRKEHNNDAGRLVRHFARRSDIISIRSMYYSQISGSGEPDKVVPDDIDQWVESNFSFIEDPETARAHYELIGKTHTDSFESAGREPRLQELIRWMGMHPDINDVLDVGCAQGCYAIHLSNAHERLSIAGIDHDQKSIEWARRYIGQHAVNKKNVYFFTDYEYKQNSYWIPDKGRDFDCLLLCEILEHVKEPWDLVDEYEQYVRPGGWVYITVPRGPWEHMSYRTYPHRCHVWEFDHHDLSDMFGKKKNVSVAYMANGKSNLTGDPIGWHVITYQVDGKKTGTIDMARKLAYQRPRQSISVAIIAGPGVEDTVGWCLSPLRDVVDEIVVADNGLTDAALTILHMAGAKVVAGADPMQEGFDVSRNKALDACTMDWVLWIDTDERLVYPDRLSKYLRQNHWQGYGLRQHHFAVDTKFEPDMPVRLYRRAARDGKSMRHYGSIHEHPELSLNEGPGPIVVLSDIHIAHIGYLDEEGRQRRYWRNLPLLQMDIAKNPDRLIQKHFICRDNCLMARYILSANGGQLTEQVRGLCEQTVELYRKHFMGKPGYVNINTLQYYSEALKFLGRGIDVEMNLIAEPPGKLNGGATRFENEEDLRAEIDWRVRDAVTPLMGKYY